MKIIEKLSAKNADISSGSPVTIVFLGDSVTQGCFELYESLDHSFEERNDYGAVYHAQLKKMLTYIYPKAPINIINAGIGGNRAQNGYERLERDVLRYSPDLVIVCFGLNDACEGLSKLSQYVESLDKIFVTLQNRGIETIFMTPNMMNTYLSPLTEPECLFDFAARTSGIQNDGTMDRYMEAARELCLKEVIPVCDCYAVWKKFYESGVNTTGLLSNHINHPTREMHLLFAALLFETIFS